MLVTTFASNAARLQTLGHVAKETGRAALRRRPLARPHPRGRAERRLPAPISRETVDFDTAMELPRARGADRRHRRAGRAARRARPHRLRAAHRSSLERRRPRRVLVQADPRQRDRHRPHPEPLAASGRRDGHRPAERTSTSPAIPGGPNSRRCTAGSGRRSSCPSTARCATCRSRRGFGLASGMPSGMVQKNGDIVRLAPGEPGKLGEEKVGRLVLDGDVIVPADGETMNERRKLSWQGVIAVALRSATRAARGEVQARPQACRSRRIATPSSRKPLRRGRRRCEAQRQARRRSCARSVRLAARRCATAGPARSRWSTCCCPR